MQPFLEALDFHGKPALGDFIGRRETCELPQPFAYATAGYVPVPVGPGTGVVPGHTCRKTGARALERIICITCMDGLPGLQVGCNAARERMVLWVHGFCLKMRPGMGGLPV
jgi:hypothetical protein